MAVSKLAQAHALHLLIVTPCASALETIEESVSGHFIQESRKKIEWSSKPIGHKGYRLKLVESVRLKTTLSDESQIVNIGIAVAHSGSREELSNLLQELEESCRVFGLLVFIGSCSGREPVHVSVGDIIVPQAVLGQESRNSFSGRARGTNQLSLMTAYVHKSIEQGLRMHMKREENLRVVVANNCKIPEKFKSRWQGNAVEINLSSDCHFGCRVLSLTDRDIEEHLDRIMETYPDVAAIDTDTDSYAFVSAATEIFRSTPCLVIQMVLGVFERDQFPEYLGATAACAVSVLFNFLQKCPDLLRSTAQCMK